ncbi:MAG: DUF2851 family protein [Rhodothermales bacterium]|nr:DUF2851 family protein [Rhodothermales bacterium]
MQNHIPIYRDRWDSAAAYPTAACDPGVRLDQLPEDFVQDLWRQSSYDTTSLRSVAGQAVRVRNPGRHNRDGGPDFVNARLRVGSIEWVGDVEIHVRTEDWFRHGHHRDPRYNSVVLHVTLVADLWTGSVSRSDGTTVEEIVLSEHLGASLRRLLHQFRTRDHGSIVCENEWPQVPRGVKDRAVRRMSRLRLLRRSMRTEGQLSTSTSSEILYKGVFRALGFSKNEESMLELAERVPLATARELVDPLDVEALFLGMAGLIPSDGKQRFGDAERLRIQSLQKRFNTLRDTVDREPMLPNEWQFFRLRPSNFPPLRISQASALVAAQLLFNDDTLDNLDLNDDPDVILARLSALLDPALDEFWETHYRLERTAAPHSARIGTARAHRIIINAILPLLVARQSDSDRRSAVKGGLMILTSLPAEDDELTRYFRLLGARPATARESQGLHELHQSRCDQHGCLRCDVGRHILRVHR